MATKTKEIVKPALPASVPELNEGINSYTLTWIPEMVKINASKLQDSDGLKGEILVTDISGNLIYQSQFNFSSGVTRDRLAETLSKRAADRAWSDILQQLCYIVIRQYRQGEPVVRLSNHGDIKKPEYLIHPLILKNEINMIFGEGGSGKSYLALMLAAVATQSLIDNPLLLAPISNGRKINCLYLDWEAHPDILQYRWKMVTNGLGIGERNCEIDYRTCMLPLADDLEQIQNDVEKYHSDFVIVDSVGQACGGRDINKQEVAVDFMNAVRRIRATTLLIHHTSKSPSGRVTPFGSAYFTSASRSIYEVQRKQEAGDKDISLCLQHYKHNYSSKLEPLGTKITFVEDEYTKFEKMDAGDIPDFRKYYTVSQRVQYAIEDNGGSCVVKVIGDAAGLSLPNVLAALNTCKEKFIRIENGEKDVNKQTWSLL